jgi:MarR family transcriptional regulator for hemolysin
MASRKRGTLVALQSKPAPSARRSKQSAAPSSPARKASVAKMADSDNWDQRLGFLMHDVSRLRRNVFDEFMKPLGVTRSQWWVLAYLSRHDGMIQSDLANVLDLGKAALGGLIDRLEASGLVGRRSDEVDRRAKRVYLSSKGVQLISEMRLRSHEMSERMLIGLDLSSRKSLADLLTQVKHNLLAIRDKEGLEVASDENT